jgi:hypothetical protein
MRCNVCSKIQGRNKLLVPKFDHLIKHLNFKKFRVARLGLAISAYYVKPNNAHLKNEKLYASTRRDMIVDLIEKVEKTKEDFFFCNLSIFLCQSSINLSQAKTWFDEVQLHKYASK